MHGSVDIRTRHVDPPATPAPEQIEVAIVEDHLALRKGIELLLRSHGFRIAGVAGDAEAGLDLVRRREPGVAVIDIGLPGGSGLELARALLEERPHAGVLVYTGSGDREALARAIEYGARGFALKSGSPEELVAAILAVANGGTYFDPRLASVVVQDSSAQRLGRLSPREREVLDLLARGLNGEQVATTLHLSPETIRTHVRNAMSKLEAKTRVHALAIALRRNEIRL